MNVIAPSVGRVVWVRDRPETVDAAQPEVALVTYVHTERLINVAGFNANGTPFSLTSLRLIQPDVNAAQDGVPYAEWMPYQKGQAAKTEELEKHVMSVGDLSTRDVEREIQRKNLNAPRVHPEDLENAIAGESYYVFPGTTLTVCALLLRNGFVVTGESAAASPENFDEELGRKIARQNAKQKIWPLLGYALRERLASAPKERPADAQQVAKELELRDRGVTTGEDPVKNLVAEG